MRAEYPDQWNLYLLGLDQLHTTSQDQPFSYYGLAGEFLLRPTSTETDGHNPGIHGKPYQTWLDAPGHSHKIGNSGYCPHSMALFLGWHRPYLALFEVRWHQASRLVARGNILQQELYARIRNIAEFAPADQIERYRWAAYSFRMPYWDWSLGDQSGDVPDFFMTETIAVNTPEGRIIEIWNPLYKYDFKPVPSVGQGAFDGKVCA
jgi:tyrosinase